MVRKLIGDWVDECIFEKNRCYKSPLLGKKTLPTTRSLCLFLEKQEVALKVKANMSFR